MRSEKDHSKLFLPDEYSRLQLAAVLVSIILAHVIISPPVYAYGISNHNTQLTLIKHAMDSSYLASDWYVDLATGFGTPYYYYVELVATISEGIGLPNTVFILYVLSSIGIVAGVWLFIDQIYQDKLVALITAGLVLAHELDLPDALPYPPELGGNVILKTYLIPSHFANAFILIGLAYAAKARYRRSFALLGIATVFHVVNGFWIAVTAGLCVAAVEAGPDLRAKKVKQAIKQIPWDAAVIYGLISSLVIAPALYRQLTTETGPDTAYIIAWVRNPHHFVLSTWGVTETLTTIALIVVSIVLIYYFNQYLFSDNRTQLFVFTYISSLVLILFLGGYVFTEIFPIDTIITLQPYRIDDFLYVILYGGLAKLVLLGLYRVSNQLSVDYSTLSVGTVCTVLIIGSVFYAIPLAVSQMGANSDSGASESISDIYIETPSRSDDLQESYRWIETETPEDAVFLASPKREGFRLGTSRAMVVDFKAFPPGGDGPVQWEQRMNTVCDSNIRQYDERGFSIRETCDSRFHNLTENEIQNAAESYDAGWILTKNGNYSFQHEYSAGEYHIYRINESPQ